MKRLLIVNADDCNLTPQVTRAILEGHDSGILTSTTFMINLPVESRSLREIKKRKRLGVGLHLNGTFGEPVLKPSKVNLLVGKDGKFLKVGAALDVARLRQAQGLSLQAFRRALALEYDAQIRRFKTLFGKLPTHLDTHHQMHDEPLYFKVLCAVAQKYRLPIRRSRLMLGTVLLRPEGPKNPRAARLACGGIQEDRKIKTTDYFFGNLRPEGYWRKEALITVLQNLPEGISEIMCHPGKVDQALCRISSFTLGREKEWRLFASPFLRRLISSLGIQLTHFGICYT